MEGIAVKGRVEGTTVEEKVGVISLITVLRETQHRQTSCVKKI